MTLVTNRTIEVMSYLVRHGLVTRRTCAVQFLRHYKFDDGKYDSENGAAKLYKKKSSVAFIDTVEKFRDPFPLLLLWLEQAKVKLIRADVFTLSTVSLEGRITSRCMFCRKIEKNCLYALGDSNNRMFNQIKKNPKTSINFFWDYLNAYGKIEVRQIRINGICTVDDKKEAEHMYSTEPLYRKIRAALYKTNEVINWKSKKLEHDLLYNDIISGKRSEPEMPDHVVLFRISIEDIEFYQTHPYEIADRIFYQKDGEKGGKILWKHVHLAP